jgi:rfaE bifunctional protein nucleotidyltransferase chain/domain
LTRHVRPPGTATPAFADKIATRATLAQRIALIPRPMVFTNGVFDILHLGHASYLAQARALGASLVVGVNSDQSVRRLGKGEDRPINPLEDRIALVAALESVSLAVPFDEDTPLELVLACRPDVIVKGGDYTADTTVGAREVSGWGGRFESIPLLAGRSTSGLLRRMRRQGT